MALDPKLLNSLPDTLVDMYGLVEIDILSDMARRISTYDYFIPAALHQNQKLQELGLTQSEIIARLAALTGQTQEELVALLSDASAEAIEDDVDYYTRADVYEPSKVNTEALHAQLNSGLLQTEQAFFNITMTTAMTATKQFERALDRAWTQINTGGMSHTEATRRAIIDVAEQGIRVIEYPSGHVDTLEVAVRRAVVTGVNQTAAKTQEVLADELGVDLVEVTAHGGARPEHAKWQGQVYSRKGEITIDGVTYKDFRSETGYGTGAGLCGWNCRHNFHPYVHGTARTWTEKQLEALEAKNIKYNGKEYTEYEASQEQRKIERNIRELKRTVEALEAGGQDASAYRSKLKDAQKTYTDFSKQTGLKKQSARTQIGTAKAKRAVAKQSSWIKTDNLPPSVNEYDTPEEYAKAKREYDGNKKYVANSMWENKHTYSDAEMDKVKRFDATVAQLQDKYPLPAQNSSLVVGDYDLVQTALTAEQRKRANKEIATAQQWINPKTNTTVIGFDPTKATGTLADDLVKRQEALNKGEIISDILHNSAEGHAIHEYGHAQARHIELAMMEDNEDAQAYYKWYKSLEKEEIRKGLSEYATKNRFEFEAECFAELQTNNPRPIARKYGEFLAKISGNEVQTPTPQPAPAQNARKVLTNNDNNDILSANNEKVRKEYVSEVSKIKDNIDKSLPIEEQARQAFEARNAARDKARDAMIDKEIRETLDKEHPNKTFEELIADKMKRKGMTREEAIKDIYKTATKTNEDVNKQFGVEGE